MTKKRRIRMIPALRPCPKCLVDLEPGTNPDGLAHHGCRPVTTAEQLEAVVVARAYEDLTRGKADVGEVAKVIRLLRQAGPGRPPKAKPAPEEAPVEESEREKNLRLVSAAVQKIG